MALLLSREDKIEQFPDGLALEFHCRHGGEEPCGHEHVHPLVVLLQ